ncbi:sel1 repeat family protein [Akkermansiaceae bacterium]|nr:sel1 repeat family protein [Akkermansiaceae bacterium]
MKSVLSVLLLCFLLASCGEETKIRERAEAGDVEAQKKLAAIYFKPSFLTGVSKDAPEAVKWTRKAAEQGDAEAQNSMGFYYFNAIGVLRDYDEGLKWYRKAAEQGNAMALHNLGLMWGKDSLGLSPFPQDDVRAYMFYNLAAAKGDENVEKYMERKREIMTKDQIAEGEKLTREWLERKAKEKGQ